MKVSVKPKKGWEVSDIYYDAVYNGDNYKKNDDIYKTYKNNSMIKFQKNKNCEEAVAFTLTF